MIYREQSIRTKQGILVSSCILLGLLGALGYSTYRMLQGIISGPTEMLMETMVLIVILYQMLGNYEFILQDEGLTIVERNLLGKKTLTIPYDLIEGVYAPTRQLSSPLKFRYKYVKMSSLDDRKVWHLVYAVEGKKIKHARVTIKASEAFFEALRQHLPDRVQVPQEDVVFNAYVRIDAHKHGESPTEYLDRIRAASKRTDGSEKKVYEL